MWNLFPRCGVTVTIDDQEPVSVGYASPRLALEEYLKISKGNGSWQGSQVEVRESHTDGVTLAYAVRKDPLFGEWPFLELADQDELRKKTNYIRPTIGICVEGIGVDFMTPGFNEQCVVSIANAVGSTAPKTNVARSALEDTAEYRNMLSAIYKLYSNHVTSEIVRLEKEENYSLSGAVNETPYIAMPLLKSNRKPIQPDLLNSAVRQIPMLVVEDQAGRRNISFEELAETAEFWTIESPLSRSIETFVREAPGAVTASALLATLGNAAPEYPKGSAVCNYGSVSHIDEVLRSKFEICEVSMIKTLRRIDLKWSVRDVESRWLRSSTVFDRLFSLDQRAWESLQDARSSFRARRWTYSWNIGRRETPIGGLGASGGFITSREAFLVYDQPISKFICLMWSDKSIESVKSTAACFSILVTISEYLGKVANLDLDQLINAVLSKEMSSNALSYISDTIGLSDALRRSNLALFNPNAWERGTELYSGD
jgi:molecular chaperone HtpG